MPFYLSGPDSGALGSTSGCRWGAGCGKGGVWGPEEERRVGGEATGLASCASYLSCRRSPALHSPRGEPGAMFGKKKKLGRDLCRYNRAPRTQATSMSRGSRGLPRQCLGALIEESARRPKPLIDPACITSIQPGGYAGAAAASPDLRRPPWGGLAQHWTRPCPAKQAHPSTPPSSPVTHPSATDPSQSTNANPPSLLRSPC